MLSLDEIRRALASHEPTTAASDEHGRAAVAMILRQRAGSPELLLIERAEREGDPWSGHMALPGGRVDASDPDSRAAAERETLEEVGVDLKAAESLGRLDDLVGRRAAGERGLVISAFVYHLSEPPPLVTNYEVREAFWFPLASLHESERHVDHPWARERTTAPGILVGEPGRHVVWGLTYRFLEVFFEILGAPLPDRWREELR